MDKALKVGVISKGEVMSDRTSVDNWSSLVQLSRQDHYSDQARAKTMTIYVFGFNVAQCS